MRLKPYTRKGEKKQSSRTKFKKPEMATSSDKLEVKNANRSLKKAYRAELKKQINNILKNPDDEMEFI